MTLTLERLNAAPAAEFVALLAGVYERAPWIAERAAAKRPFSSLPPHIPHLPQRNNSQLPRR